MELTENQTIGERLKSYLAYKNITATEFEKSICVANGFVSNAIKGSRAMGSDKLAKMLETYEDLNLIWLLSGKGNMINPIKDVSINNDIEDKTESIEINLNDNIGFEIVSLLKKQLADKEYIIELQKQLLELKK